MDSQTIVALVFGVANLLIVIIALKTKKPNGAPKEINELREELHRMRNTEQLRSEARITEKGIADAKMLLLGQKQESDSKRIDNMAEDISEIKETVNKILQNMAVLLSKGNCNERNI